MHRSLPGGLASFSAASDELCRDDSWLCTATAYMRPAACCPAARCCECLTRASNVMRRCSCSLLQREPTQYSHEHRTRGTVDREAQRVPPSSLLLLVLAAANTRSVTPTTREQGRTTPTRCRPALPRAGVVGRWAQRVRLPGPSMLARAGAPGTHRGRHRAPCLAHRVGHACRQGTPAVGAGRGPWRTGRGGVQSRGRNGSGLRP